MYIGGRGDGNRNRGELKIPEQYSGSALSRTDPEKLELLSDKEALRHAEEVFRRGYVFEEQSTVSEPSDTAVSANAAETELVETAGDVTASPTAALPSEEVAAGGKARTLLPTGGGLLSGLIDSVKIEHIILIALIIILYDSKADDQLLIMLAILFFC